MTDIAILVAEEFERRLSHSTTQGKKQEIGLVSCVYDIMAQSLKKIKIIGEEKNLGFVSLVTIIEPKTQIGLAASNGFFSA